MRTLLQLICLCLSLLVAEVYAQPTNREAATRAYEEAEIAYKLQKYQAALESFQKSYSLSKEPSILFNIAQCYRLLGHPEEAKKTYQTFLRDAPRDSPLKANAEARIAEVDAEIKRLATKGILEITTKQDPTEVYLNGEGRGKSPLLLNAIEPGDYKVTLKKAGFSDFEATVSIKPSSTSQLKGIQLVPLSTFPIPTKPYLITSGAMAVGGALAAGGFVFFSLKAKNIQDDLVIDNLVDEDRLILENQERSDTLSAVSTAFFIGAVGVLSTGVIIKLRASKKATQE